MQKIMLKLSKTSTILLASIVNAGIGFADFLVTRYLPPDVAIATVIFISAVGNAVLIYLATTVEAP